MEIPENEMPPLPPVPMNDAGATLMAAERQGQTNGSRAEEAPAPAPQPAPAPAPAPAPVILPNPAPANPAPAPAPLPVAPVAEAAPAPGGFLARVAAATRRDDKASVEGLWITTTFILDDGLPLQVKVAMSGEAAWKIAMAREMAKRGVTQGDIETGQKAEQIIDAYANALGNAVIKGLRPLGSENDAGEPFEVAELVAMLKQSPDLVSEVERFANNRQNYLERNTLALQAGK